MSSPSYDPGEERQFVFATLGLIAALVVLGAVLVAATPDAGGSGGAGSGSSSEGEAAGRASGGAGGETTAAAGPEDLTFLCDVGLELPEATDISSDQEEAARMAAEEFVRAAYGYAGGDTERYQASLESRVVEGCFWTSVAGEDVEAMEETVQLGGEENAAGDQLFLEDYVGFYVEEEQKIARSGQEYVLVTGVAVWVSRPARTTSFTSPDDLVGVQQRLTLANQSGSGEGAENWKVVEGEGPTGLDPTYERAARQKAEEIVNGEGS